jgi:hypothetical protein
LPAEVLLRLPLPPRAASAFPTRCATLPAAPPQTLPPAWRLAGAQPWVEPAREVEIHPRFIILLHHTSIIGMEMGADGVPSGTPPTPGPLGGGGPRTAPGRTRRPPPQDDVDGQPSYVGDGHVQGPDRQPRGRPQSLADLPDLPPLSDRQTQLPAVLRAAVPPRRQPDRVSVHRNVPAQLVLAGRRKRASYHESDGASK